MEMKNMVINGRYQILKKIGEGSFGQVYLGKSGASFGESEASRGTPVSTLL